MNQVDSKQHMQNTSKLKRSKFFDVIITLVIFRNKWSTLGNSRWCNSFNI